MSARVPRRSFGTPLVVTLAALPAACTPASTTPSGPSGPQQPPVVIANPPPPGPNPGTTKTDPAPLPAPAAYQEDWNIVMAKGSCKAYPRANCPKPEPGKPIPTCNPPPPIDYTCFDGMSEGDSIAIVLRQGAVHCVRNLPPPKCPPNVACNPPPPQLVECPKR